MCSKCMGIPSGKPIFIFMVILFAVFISGSAVIADDSVANTNCARIYYIKGNVYSLGEKAVPNNSGRIQVCQGTYIRTGKKSGCSILFNNGIDIRVGEASRIEMEKITGSETTLNLVKGRIWAETGKSMKANENVKVKTRQGDIVFKNGIFSINDTVLETYKGMAQVIKDGNKIEIFQGNMFGGGKKQKINQKQPPAGWDSSNINSDKLNVLIDLKTPDEYKDLAQSVFKNMYSMDYSVGKAVFSTKDAASMGDYDVIVSADLQILKETNPDKEGKIQLSGTVVESASGKNIGVMDFSENILNSVENKFLIKSIQAVLMKAAESSIQNISFFRDNITGSGRAVIVELADTGKEETELIKAYINNLPGLNELAEKEFYGQKTIFQLNYAGTGDNIAEFLEGKKVRNKVINVWKYSKNNVKLNIK